MCLVEENRWPRIQIETKEARNLLVFVLEHNFYFLFSLFLYFGNGNFLQLICARLDRAIVFATSSYLAKMLKFMKKQFQDF